MKNRQVKMRTTIQTVMILVFNLCFVTSSFAQRSGSNNTYLSPSTTGTTTMPVAPAPPANNGIASGTSSKFVPPPTPATVVAPPTTAVVPTGAVGVSGTASAPPVLPPTIQQIGKQSSGSSTTGIVMAVAAGAVCAWKIPAACSSPATAMACTLYSGCLVGAGAVAGYMAAASKKSNDTAEAVTVANPNGVAAPVTQTGSPSADGNGAVANTVPEGVNQAKPAAKPELALSPSAQAMGAKLIQDGYSVDKNGILRDPKGKVISVTPMSSPDAIRAAGLAPSITKDLLKAHAEIAALADKKAKALAVDNDTADSGGSMSGGAKTSLVSSGAVALGMPGQKLGRDRNPADVSGMQKDFKGEPIGVAGDSLFDMVDRRYQLHESQGSFLGPK